MIQNGVHNLIIRSQMGLLSRGKNTSRNTCTPKVKLNKNFPTVTKKSLFWRAYSIKI